MTELIKVSNLVYRRGTRYIYQDVELSIKAGQITGIMGPSGTGKTTLLKLIGGQLKPECGTIHIHGQDIAQLSRSELFAVRAKMGVLFQSGALFTDMSVFDNVAFPIRAHRKMSPAQISDIVSRKLADVGLAGSEMLMPSALSGGMNRRAALARAIALDPELVMYDEPFAGQDPIVKGVLKRLIAQLSETKGLTSIIVSHDVPEMLEICDYIYLINDGIVQGQGTPDELRAHNNDYVFHFLNGLHMESTAEFGS